MADIYQIITSDIVEVNITNSKNDNTCVQRRYAKSLTIADFKGKLELITGGSSSTMQLQLFSRDDNLIGQLDDNNALLGSYPVEDGMRIHVIDAFSDIEDTVVEKFVLSEEQYDSRTDTLKYFLKHNKLGKYNEEETKKRAMVRTDEARVEREKAELIGIGNRCQVVLSEVPARKGLVRFKGELDGVPGLFIGVQYDEPHGKHDGSYRGHQYFECPDKYGAFVRPVFVEVGDFPEDEINFDEEL